MSGNDHKYYNKCIQQLVVEYGEYLCNCTRYSSSLFSKPFWPYEICHHVFLGNNVMYVIPKQHFLFLDKTSFSWCVSVEKGILRNMLLIVIPTYETGKCGLFDVKWYQYKSKISKTKIKVVNNLTFFSNANPFFSLKMY